jgi:putative endonuclease
MEHPKYAVYILYSLKDHQFYTGYTANFARRLEEHSQGKCISTAPRRPFIPILCEYYLTKADALRRELYFKTSAGKRTLRLMLRESLKEIEQIKI